MKTLTIGSFCLLITLGCGSEPSVVGNDCTKAIAIQTAIWTADADVCCWSKCIAEGKIRQDGLVRTNDCVCVDSDEDSPGEYCTGANLTVAQRCLQDVDQCKANAQTAVDLFCALEVQGIDCTDDPSVCRWNSACEDNDSTDDPNDKWC